MVRSFWPLLAFAAWLLTTAQAACLGHSRPTQTLRIDVVPQFATTVVYSQWAPLLQRIGQQTTLCFDLHIAASIPDFEKSLFSGQPDLAFANPYHAVMARKGQGYIPLVRDDKELLSGLLVVRSDSPIRSPKDLDGKEVAFPAPNAFAASLLIRATLARQGVKIRPIYLKNHANVYRAVALGEVVAGAGVNNTLEREEPNLRNRLKPLYETPGYAAHPVLAHPRVPNRVREALINALIELARQSDGKSLLDAIQIPQPVRADYARDYGPLEALNLEPFVVVDGQ